MRDLVARVERCRLIMAVPSEFLELQRQHDAVIKLMTRHLSLTLDQNICFDELQRSAVQEFAQHLRGEINRVMALQALSAFE